MLDLVSAAETEELVRFLSAEIRKLAAAGADIALLASNTPHIVFDELERSSPIPLVSIVRSTCQVAKALGLKTVGLIGTRFTMHGKFYPEVFAKEGITVVAPDQEDQTYTHDKYMNELVNAEFLPETRSGLLAVVERMKRQKQIEGGNFRGNRASAAVAGCRECRDSLRYSRSRQFGPTPISTSRGTVRGWTCSI